MVKRLIIVMLIISLVFSLVACGSSTSSTSTSNESQSSQTQTKTSDEQESIVIKIGHPAMPESARDIGAQKIKEIVEKESGGRIKVQIYPAQQLGSLRDTIESLQNGNVEMAILPSSAFGGFQPLTTLLDIPYFLPTDENALLELFKSDAMKQLLATTDEIGVKTLDIWFNGYKQFTANKPLKTPADFQGLKFRMIPNPVLSSQFEVVGASGVNIDFSEVYSALQTGALDGQENPMDVNYEQKFYEVQKYITMSNHGVIAHFVSVSKKWWDSLSQEDQKIIEDAVAQANDVFLDAVHKNIKEDTDLIIKSGKTTIIELTPEEINTLKKAFAPVKDVYISEYGERAKNLIDTFEKEMQKLQ